MRTVLFVAIAILCASCRTDTQLDPIQTTTPIIDTAEISAREDCLYREVGRLLEPKGALPPVFIMLQWPPLDFVAKP
jgi:hypothetical protein